MATRLLPALFSVFFLGVQAEPVRLEGSDLYLDAPPGFVPAASFSGLQQIQTASSIEVRELAASFDSVTEALAADKLVLEGILLIESTRFESAGRPALLLELEKEISGVPFNQWQLVIGDELRSLIITAAYPSWAAETMSEPLKQSLLSAKWLRTPEEQLFYDLPFTLSETDDLKFAKRTTNMLVLADLTGTGTLTGRSPSIVVGHLTTEEELVDYKSIAHRQLTAVAGLEITGILEEGETRIDGIRAYRIKARARLAATDSEVIFEQVLAFQPHKYLLIQSAVEEPAAARYAPQFEQVLASIKFKAMR